MKRLFLIFLITLLLGVLEVTIFPYHLAFLWVICFSMANGENESFFLAFLAGILSDFLKGGPLAESSLVFLGSLFVVTLYKRKFKVHHPLYFFPFLSFAYLFYNFFEFGEFMVFQIPYSLIVAVFLFKIAQILRSEKEVRLEVL